jgi:hypothetical protein
MTSAMLLRLACLLLAAAVAAPAFAGSSEQRASFSVAVTLHTAVKPLSAAQLCEDGRLLQALGATIEVDCTNKASAGEARDATAPRAAGSVKKQLRPEVTVTF